MGNTPTTFEGNAYEKQVTSWIGSDMHNGPDMRSRIACLPAFGMAALCALAGGRRYYIGLQSNGLIFGGITGLLYTSAGALILDRAGNMGSDYAFIASVWLFIENRIRLSNKGGQFMANPSNPGLLGERSLSYFALASGGYHFLYSYMLRSRPLKDQLVTKYGPRHKPHIGDD